MWVICACSVAGIFLQKNARGGHIETFYTLGGASHVPICSHAGGMIHLRGGRATFRGGEVPPLPPSKKNPGVGCGSSVLVVLGVGHLCL